MSVPPSTNSTPVLTPIQEAALVVSAVAQITASLSTSISVANWPLYVFEAVSIVYSGIEMSVADRKNVIIAILQQLVNSSPALSASEKTELNAIIQNTAGAAIDALLKANSVVVNWVETESKTVWQKLKDWCSAHGCCKCCRKDDAVPDNTPVVVPTKPASAAPAPSIPSSVPAPPSQSISIPIPVIPSQPIPIPSSIPLHVDP